MPVPSTRADLPAQNRRVDRTGLQAGGVGTKLRSRDMTEVFSAKRSAWLAAVGGASGTLADATADSDQWCRREARRAVANDGPPTYRSPTTVLRMSPGLKLAAAASTRRTHSTRQRNIGDAD